MLKTKYRFFKLETKKDMECMFYNCKKLNFDLSKWNVNNVENIKDMFTYCTSLKNKPSWYKK